MRLEAYADAERPPCLVSKAAPAAAISATVATTAEATAASAEATATAAEAAEAATTEAATPAQTATKAAAALAALPSEASDEGDAHRPGQIRRVDVGQLDLLVGLVGPRLLLRGRWRHRRRHYARIQGS